MEKNTLCQEVEQRLCDQMFRYLQKQGYEISRKNDSAISGLSTEDEVRAYQKRIHDAFCCSLREDMCSGVLADAVCTGTVKRAHYRIEKVVLTTKNNVKITTNLYIPEDNSDAAKPAILFVCGHSEEGKASEDYQYAQGQLAKAGFIVLAVDALGQGERFTYYNPQSKSLDVQGCTEEHSYYGVKAAMCDAFLYNLFMRDMDIALQYLCAREDVDTERIGATGNSGGGTQTSFLMLAGDERIKAFAPATFITDYMMLYDTAEPQDDEQIVPGIIGKNFGYTDIVLSVAPKPVLLLGVNRDFFPIEGLMKVYGQAKRIYEILGKKENLQIVIDGSVHKYSKSLVKNAVDFFSAQFFGKSRETDAAPDILDQNLLNCFPQGQISLTGAKLPDEEIRNYFYSHKKTDAEKAKQLLAGQIMTGREIKIKKFESMGSNICGNLRVHTFLLKPLPGIRNIACVYSRSISWKKQKKVVVFSDEGNLAAEKPDFLNCWLEQDLAVIIIDTANYGLLQPRKRNPYDIYGFYGMNYFFAHHLFFRGDSFAAFKSFEILSDIYNIREQFGGIEKIVGRGLTENNLCASLFVSDLTEKVEFSDMNFSLEKIITGKFYDNHDIRSVIYPGFALLYDFDKIKRSLSRGYEKIC